MRRGETVASARRIGPLLALDANGAPVLGEDFAGAGELEQQIDGGAFGASAGVLGEIGNGYYYLEVPEADAAAAQLWIAAKLAIVCEEFVFREDVERVPTGIALNEADPTKRRIGPLLAVDEDGNELDEAALAGVTTEVTINGSAWVAAAGALVIADDGYPHYEADPSEIAQRGWLCVKIDGACEEFTMREDIVGGPPVVAVVTPPIGDADPEDELVLDVTDDVGLDYIMVFAVVAGAAKPDPVFRGGDFLSGYTIGSWVEDVAGGKRLHVRRDAKWPPGACSLVLDIIDVEGLEA